jgi:hypothetical protein
MEILGHSDIRLTQNIYTHAFDEAKREAADVSTACWHHMDPREAEQGHGATSSAAVVRWARLECISSME